MTLNYKSLIRNEFENARANYLNHPFNGIRLTRFMAIGKIWRKVNRRGIGGESLTAYEFYCEMRELV